MTNSTKKLIWKAFKIIWLLIGISILLLGIFLFIGIILGGLVAALIFSIFLAWAALVLIFYVAVTFLFLLIKYLSEE